MDHVFNFSITPDDDKIWFRNYQIVDEEEKKLEEIGKFVNPKRTLRQSQMYRVFISIHWK